MELESDHFSLDAIPLYPSELFQLVIRFVLPSVHDQPVIPVSAGKRSKARQEPQYRNNVQAIGKASALRACLFRKAASERTCDSHFNITLITAVYRTTIINYPVCMRAVLY